MTILNHILGFPRIGINRELKKAQESYWSGFISEQELLSIGSTLRKRHWKNQTDCGIDIIPVGDFAWYDHVLTTSLLLGNIPTRHNNKEINLDTLFRIARGKDAKGNTASASEMKKWFNTNYHYIVPEFTKDQHFSFTWSQLIEEVDEALALGYQVKPIILGPLTYLWLGKIKGEIFDRLDLLKKILPVYEVILDKLFARGIKWVQFDEPLLVLDLEDNWKKAYSYVYNSFRSNIKILLTTYFESVHDNINFIKTLPIHGLHIDIVHGKYNLSVLNNEIDKNWLLSLGVINGRNIWKADLPSLFSKIKPLLNIRKNIWIGSSCSFLHIPIDLNMETTLDKEVKNWFSFALQKCIELSLLKNALNTNEIDSLVQWSRPIYDRIYSNNVHNQVVQNRLLTITKKDYTRNSNYVIRSNIQNEQLNLPILPTTTIGSFPQTMELRQTRSNFKNNKISIQDYNLEISKNIKKVIKLQEKLDLDILVHGESERNDMVEYFGENLNGFAFTNYGWIQSYGSRCVKPPIIISDISRPKPITLDWTKYAQSLTTKPIKGMLTGPITILCWSFPREDLSREKMSKQIALALRDEVKDLENIGIKVIQIDEPALREGLPLRKQFWSEYLSWAVSSFRLCSSVAKDKTQIHTHMCYCEFSDIIDAIIALDVDVITIETARSNLEILNFFKKFNYKNAIGPGIYDIHSPNIPSIKEIELFLRTAMKQISLKQLWVNPDCGLKTRDWKEIEISLKNMVQAAKNLRKRNK